MLEKKDIEHLAALARIKLSDAEEEKFLKEIEPVLGYVAQVKEVVSSVGEEKRAGAHRNIARDDERPYESGARTADIVADMPESQDGYLKVKKIL